MKTIFAMAALAAFFVTQALANDCLKYTYRGAIHCVHADGTLDQPDLMAAEAEPSAIETFVRNNDAYIDKFIFGGLLAICLLISHRFLLNPILRRIQARAIRREQARAMPVAAPPPVSSMQSSLARPFWILDGPTVKGKWMTFALGVCVGAAVATSYFVFPRDPVQQSYSLHAAHEHYLHQKYCDREMRDPICADIAEERRAGADRIAAERKKQEAYRADAKRREDDELNEFKKNLFGQILAHPEQYCEGGTLNKETFKCEK